MRIQGDLRKLGIRIGATTVRPLLRAHRLGQPPGAPTCPGRSSFGPQAEGIVACDFLTV